MKKALSLSLLLLANIILLAHAAVPHHHHETICICFCNTPYCEGNKGTCTHEHHDANTTHHENNHNEQCCSIDTIYTAEYKNIKTSCHVHEKCDCGKTVVYVVPPNSLYTSDFVDETIIHFRQNPDLPLFYSEFISQSIGLRAPPAC